MLLILALWMANLHISHEKYIFHHTANMNGPEPVLFNSRNKELRLRIEMPCS